MSYEELWYTRVRQLCSQGALRLVLPLLPESCEALAERLYIEASICL